MAKEDKKSTVTIEKVKPVIAEPVSVAPRIFVEGKIQINGTITRKQFDKSFKGKINVDINQLWIRYQNWLNKK